MDEHQTDRMHASNRALESKFERHIAPKHVHWCDSIGSRLPNPADNRWWSIKFPHSAQIIISPGG
ncbi:hypothetical protein M408DRAFT_178878 [Serendipita vermifera MAFF 305830]|uniref:Uncharacterized protein n=1 Tax=Serendipita vermifera MAFF 305830 TaxID=933852 RepID=A0A0C2XBZ4_SERVB|nr:hypothetical protein M408DRAFT_178878 [Serendipita vermifera MAFF 305830]